MKMNNFILFKKWHHIPFKEEGTHAIGEAVEGFGYLNQKQEPALTTTIPTVRIGSYGFGTLSQERDVI